MAEMGIEVAANQNDPEPTEAGNGEGAITIEQESLSDLIQMVHRS